MLTSGEAVFQFETPEIALEEAYARGEDDEFVQPTIIGNERSPATSIQDNDSVIFMNFRSDRARQITRAFTDNDFLEFDRKVCPQLASFTTLTQYASTIDSSIAYPPEKITNCLGEILANAGKNQLRIAETEKYAHVTFFFNGGIEEKFKNEDRILVPSPNVKTYDLKPDMSAIEVTDQLIKAIESRKYDAIICNYANGDMVGHTGNFEAAIEAVEVLDNCMNRVLEAITRTDGEMLITADHGNVEKMRDTDSNQPLTSHTSGPVPLVYVGKSKKDFSSEGSLCDIAPTLLAILDLNQPQEMSGVNLLDKSRKI
jgi:2,3-bisphosphoglycerate-independent phosphoglycerate mutase